MLLKSYYKNRNDAQGNSYFMLTLNFNNVNMNEIRRISEYILMFIKINWHQKNCNYEVHCDNKIRYTSDLLKIFNKSADIDFFAAGYVSNSKTEIKEISEKSCQYYNDYKYINYNNLIDNLKTYFSQNIIGNEIYDKSDFSVNFRTESYEEICSFECQLKVNTFSIEYQYKEVLEQYKDLISYFDMSGNLFAAYIDINSFNGFLEYEYCYKNLDERDNKYYLLRNCSYAAYMNNNIASNSINEKLKKIADVYVMNNGCFYSCRCAADEFSYYYKRILFEILYDILPAGFGLVDILTLIQSGFKPCCKDIHIFKRIGICIENGYDVEDISYCAVFYKGFNLKEIITVLKSISEDENFANFEYVETIKRI